MQTVYLDHNSTTAVDPRVLGAMLPFFSEQFGNAGSKTHAFGLSAARAVEQARNQVAALLNCDPSEVYFTSGATEAVNLAIRGAMQAYRSSGRHLVTVATEHKAVLDTVSALGTEGVEVTILPVDFEGRLDLEQLEKSIRSDTVLVAVMMANNETGVLQDTAAIGKICAAKNVLFFSDTTQAAGKVMLDVKEQQMAMACLSAHKLYGPKGAGALYVSRRNPRVALTPQITGGGQENGMRSGTLNVPGIVGLGKACEIAATAYWEDSTRQSSLRTILEQLLEQSCGVRINGSIRYRLPNTVNLQFPRTRASALITAVPQMAVSTGSACTSALPEPSHVLTAMGLSPEAAKNSVRFSLGRSTTREEINYITGLIAKAVNG